ncbi:MAG: hypothetical protein KIT11_04995 [Fimbriimonadaceae bacterium]|nr:hypothetical protein [Fimbriimonadaceae bacterium]QYK56749.1 MAG: hypothetical protein KF733_04525 [Fimbriimonadaceae bacterium]
MKSQNDLIVSIVAGVVAIGVFCGFFFTKRQPIKPADPTPVPLQDAKIAEGNVTFANNLPGGGQGAPGGAAIGGAAPGAVGAGGFRRKQGGAAGVGK